MSETLTELDNLSKTVRASARVVLYMGIHAGVQRRDGQQNVLCKIKQVPVVKRVKI